MFGCVFGLSAALGRACSGCGGCEPVWEGVGPGIDFRKFLWKFDGLGDRPFPETSLEIWGLGGKFGGWGWGGVKFTELTGRNDMKIAFFTAF